jgi:hypothetical protein
MPDDHDLLIGMDVKLNMLLTQNGDHEVRLRRLERALWIFSGAAFAGGTGGGAIVAKLIGG